MEYADVSAIKSVTHKTAPHYLNIGWVVLGASYYRDAEDGEGIWAMLIGWPRENGEPREH